MENSIDHIDDFDDEFDETWIDELEDADSEDLNLDGVSDDLEISDAESLAPPLAQPPKKKKKATPILMIALLSGVGFGGYKAHEAGLIFPKPKNEIPVVQLSKNTPSIILEDSNNDTQPPEEITATLPLQQDTNVENNIVAGQDSISETPPNEILETQGDILTPMPFGIGESSIELPNLEETNAIIQTDNKSDAPPPSAPSFDTSMAEEKELQPTILDEDTLITKTDSVFDNDEIQSIEKSIDALPAPIQQEASLVPIDNTLAAPTVSPPVLHDKEDKTPLLQDMSAMDDTAIETTQSVEDVTSSLKIAPPSVEPDTEKVEDIIQDDISTQKIVETVKAYKPVWSIRAVQPGRAVIHEKKTGEMKSIEVGDTVTGLGRIKSIDNKHGQWVIKGTSGTITR